MFRSSSPTYSDPDYTMPEHTTTTRTSPLHFLYPHLPPLTSSQSTYSYSSYPTSSTTGSTNAKSHNKVAKQKRRRTPDHDDISRLLDPSYLPSSGGRSGVYIDPSGEVHDPDYRHFPLVTSPSHGSHYSSAHHGHNQQHSHHHTHGTNSHHSAKSHAGRTRGRTSPRPHFDWELAVDECALDDEYPPEEEENHQRYGYGRGGHAGGLGSASSGRSFSSAKSSSPVIVRRPRDASFSTANTSPTTWYPSPAMTDSTLPTSYEREGSLDDDKEKEVVGKKDEKKKRCRRLSKGEKEKEKKASDEEKRAASVPRTSFDYALPSTVEEEDSAPHSTDSRATREEDEDEDEMIVARHQEYVPTCSQSLRRSWQAFALRFRFGVFRAQRRMMRRVHSVI